MIETIDLPELVAVGLDVEAPRDDRAARDAAWRQLFERQVATSAFLEIRLSQQDGVCRDLVGFLAAKKTEVPDGMVRHVIPAQRYLRLLHDGPVDGIAAGFEQLRHWAAVQTLPVTDLQLDFGYLPGLPPGRHELHLGIVNTKGLLGHV